MTLIVNLIRYFWSRHFQAWEIVSLWWKCFCYFAPLVNHKHNGFFKLDVDMTLIVNLIWYYCIFGIFKQWTIKVCDDAFTWPKCVGHFVRQKCRFVEALRKCQSGATLLVMSERFYFVIATHLIPDWLFWNVTKSSIFLVKIRKLRLTHIYFFEITQNCALSS